ncbi:MAG TPA: P-loop NTPase fold protein [Gemmatimonadales bacterium]|nr:P-loop NTPase fold protein [Gemmatimonadales bacterium]
MWVSKHPTPWTLPLDAFVIPTSTNGEGGSLAHALLHDIEARYPELKNFGPLLEEPRHLTPETPIVLPRSDEWKAAGLPTWLVIATAERRERAGAAKTSQRWSAANSGAAAQAIVRLADREGWRRIAIPLLGSGGGGVPAIVVAEEVLGGIIAALPASHVHDVTIVTLDEEAYTGLAERAHARSQRFANDLPAGEDLLDVETEVSAVAEAILLRDLEPPLVVGVLGGWGSGKSFVMHLMRDRISQIRALCIENASMAWGDNRETLFPYVGHPYVITFDAWTYANADLWASLMQTVFRELGRQLTLEAKLTEAGVDPLLGGDVWKALALLNDAEQLAVLTAALSEPQQQLLRDAPAQTALTDVLWSRLMQLKHDQLRQLEEAERRRRETEAALADARRALEAQADAKLDEEARRAAWRPFANRVGKALTSALQTIVPVPKGEEPIGPADVAQFEALADHVGFLRRLWSAPWLDRLAFLSIAAAAAAVPFLDKLATVRLPAVAAGLVALLLDARRVATVWDRSIATLRHQYEAGWTSEKAKIAGRREAMLTALRANTPVPKLEKDLAQQKAEEASCREKIGTPAGFLSLAQFVQARLETAAYESKLGLMHQVQRDMASLSDCLVVHEYDLQHVEKTAFFPRGPARVVLFIDDLDRCPPEQVVAVLEAVQLLVKTRLFVVVLAMDVRYVTRALEKRYQGILWRHGDPSGLDYIEKIVQVPYRVRPIDPQAFAPFVRSQMHVAAGTASAAGGASGRPSSGDVGRPSAATQRPSQTSASTPEVEPLTRKTLDFTPEEAEIVQECCGAVELSPRSVKRVVNVYKLLKIIWHRGARYIEPGWDAKRAVVMLLALAARHPEAMRDLLDELSEAAKANDQTPLNRWLRARCRRRPEIARGAAHWVELDAALDLHAPRLGPIPVNRLGLASCNLVRSFSFLGDIGAEPDEMLSPGGHRGNDQHQDAQEGDGARLDRRRQQSRRVRPE